MIKKIIGSVSDLSAEELASCHIERIYVKNEDLAKRLHHVVSDHHRELSILLDKGTHLHVGDILEKNGNHLVIVDVLDEDVLVIEPVSRHQMGVIAHHLGNNHLPAQFIGETMVIQYDPVAETYLKAQGVPHRRESRRMEQPFRHTGHSHG